MIIPTKNIVGMNSLFPQKSSSIPITKKNEEKMFLCSLMKSENDENLITGHALIKKLN